jgi:CRISPR-associated protein Cmr6
VTDWKACQHPGLRFYRLLDGSDEEKKKGLCKGFVDLANSVYQKDSYKDLLGAIARRQELQVKRRSEAGWIAERLEVAVEWRLVAGLSYGRLWDVGIQLHPLYGVPYLPASEIKGALRSWAVEMGGDGDALKIENWFGSLNAAARVVISDAFPLAPLGKMLAEDVLNKHHAGYFEAARANKIQPPTDYDTPSPVKFITMARGVRLGFAFMVRPGDFSPSREEFVELLKSCLRHAGLGAKTRKGYGRLRVKK